MGAAVLFVVLAAGVIMRFQDAGPATVAGDAGIARERRAGDLPTLPGSPDPSVTSPPAPAPVPIADRVPQAMKDWRDAIIAKNAESVELLDRTFGENARAFIPALMESARTDPEERVRAFSTRVLGKIRSTECVPLMRQLLDDPSPYVRFNAAWVLGELADRDAATRLRQIERRDPSPMVRQAAGDSRRKIEGG